MKLKKKLLVALSSVALMLPLASCNLFKSSGGNYIQDVRYTYDDKSGNTILVIDFSDKKMDDLTLIIPRGLSGKDGVGIKDIKSQLSADGTSITITIVYDDPTVDDVVLTIPVIAGRGISEVKVENDDDGNMILTFIYTDGTSSQNITIPKGKDGNGILSFEVSEKDLYGNTTITITLTDGTVKTITVTDGAGIRNISVDESKSTSDYYALVITYTDGYKETIMLEKPKSTKWFTGTSNPPSPSVLGARVGDFYLNRVNGYIYQLESNDTWTFLFGMKAESTTREDVYHQVLFDAGEGRMYSNVQTMMVNVLEGENVPLAQFPENPVLEGKEFVGWYTSLDNINAGQFTDLTVVTRNIDLYAKYR